MRGNGTSKRTRYRHARKAFEARIGRKLSPKERVRHTDNGTELEIGNWTHDMQREYRKRYYAEHRADAIMATNAWRKENPDKFRDVAIAYRERRRLRLVGGNITAKQWRELLNIYGNMCLRCGDTKKPTMDHVVPISKGGLHIIENVQPLCRSCNSSKSDDTVDYRHR